MHTETNTINKKNLIAFVVSWLWMEHLEHWWGVVVIQRAHLLSGRLCKVFFWTLLSIDFSCSAFAGLNYPRWWHFFRDCSLQELKNPLSICFMHLEANRSKQLVCPCIFCTLSICYVDRKTTLWYRLNGQLQAYRLNGVAYFFIQQKLHLAIFRNGFQRATLQ